MRGHVAILFLLLSSTAAGDLQIEGVDGALLQNAKAFAALADEPCDAEPWRVRRRFRTLENEVAAALEPFGFYTPTIQSTLSFNDACWNATVAIQLGRPVLIRSVDISFTGGSVDDTGFVISANPPEIGSPLHHADYESYKRALRIAAVERGYFDAEFTKSQLDVWPEELAADIALHFNSGLRYRIGEIEQSADFLDAQVIAGYMDLQPGQYYESRTVARVHRDLSNSGYFSRVQVTPQYDDATDGIVPLHVHLEPADRIEYTAGVGFATDTGPRLKGGYRNRRINTAGHRFTSNLTASPVVSGLTAEYRRPLRDPRTDWMSYTGALDIEDTDTSESDAVRIGFRRSKRLNSAWLRTWSLDLSVDRFTVGQVTDTSRLLLPGYVLDHKWADRDLYPNRGRRVSLELRGSHEAFGSDTSLLQLIIRARWIRAIGDNGRLLARATLGTTAKENFSELPPSLRFFAGGDESVRGFDYQTLGPTDTDGNVIGGSHLAVASIEYEHRIRGDFFGAVFIDGGNAFDDIDVDAALGTGLGIKWRSPVGPVRLYFAHPLNQSDRDVRIHLSLGVDL